MPPTWLRALTQPGSESGWVLVAMALDGRQPHCIAEGRYVIDELDPHLFWQIHRSTLVNVKAIAAVTRDLRGRVVHGSGQRRLGDEEHGVRGRGCDNDERGDRVEGDVAVGAASGAAGIARAQDHFRGANRAQRAGDQAAAGVHTQACGQTRGVVTRRAVAGYDLVAEGLAGRPAGCIRAGDHRRWVRSLLFLSPGAGRHPQHRPDGAAGGRETRGAAII